MAWTGSDAKGVELLVSESPRQVCVEGNERKKGKHQVSSEFWRTGVAEKGVWKQSLSRRDVFWKREKQRGLGLRLRSELGKLQSALRSCLDVESTIDSYGEVIDRFGLRLAAEPPYLFTHQRLVTFADPLARSHQPRLGPCLEDRPGLDLYAGP